MHGMPPGGNIPSYQTDTAWGEVAWGSFCSNSCHANIYYIYTTMLMYITPRHKFAMLCVWLHKVLLEAASILRLDEEV